MVGRLPHAAAGWYYGLRVSGYVAAEPHRPLPRRSRGAILLEWVAGGTARGSARPCTARMHGPCGRRGVRGAGGARPQRWQQATRGECRVRRLQRLLSPSLCGTWLRRSASARAREPGVHAHLLDLCLCGLRLHVEDVPRLRLHHSAPHHRLLRRSTHLAAVCTQQAALRLGAGGS